MTWRSTLHTLLVRRYPDARDLRRLVELHLPELAADLPSEAPANRLAGDLIKAAEAHGRVPELLCVLRDACDDDDLAQVVAPYLVETEDPALAQTRRAYAEHARRVARRPPLEDLLGYLLDIPDFDLDRVFIPLSAKPPAPLEPGASGVDGPRPESRPPPAQSVTDLWPEGEPWLLLIGEPGAGKSILTRWLTAELARGPKLTPVRNELRRYASWVAK
ncbi:MAG TPA: effector-associated domain EAD1-containing protein [Nannocystaceae bacterium]|nr:effector-associated domain EAD1-containing protein [Nannocystaceae bacterium]